ncbi:tRNA glutamyl-Q(34) synthetase GluQRS [Sphingomonas crocodyli]|uniref:tRNA glutamyl-Q(34) synthetase GluQRS n=1 Tax=Sphingomonas crocodyli TaxID=1979270 RepID=UPI002682C1AD
MISRFAPSPTGRLHLGHAYSALAAHDFARERGGRFLLRIEDIDTTRSRPEHVAGIFEDLAWLGLTWDEPPVFQSQRMPLYERALADLKALGVLYPCFCTRADIAAEVAASGFAPHGPDGPLYPGTCRHLTPDERAARIGSDAHSWRLDVDAALKITGPLVWHEGDRAIDATPQVHGDVVLARKDLGTSYHLSVTIDDAAQGITDIVRGVDLFDATHVHCLLQALLNLPAPRYHHHPLLTAPDGSRLAKRHGAPSLASMRAEGVDPATLVAELRTRRAADRSIT